MALDQLDAFMNSLGELESGNNWDAVGPYTGSTYGRARGRWQIMEKIYPAWAREAGVDPNDYSPAAQEKVARHKMSQYYRQFGSWDLVAVAWFAGPGRAQQAQKRGINSVGGIKDMLGTSVSSYVSKVIGGMGDGARSAPANPRQADLAQGVGSLSQRGSPSMSPENPRQADLAMGVGSQSQRQSFIAPIEAAPGTQLTQVQQQTRDDQIGQDALGSIMSFISEQAKGSGGKILDARGLFGMSSREAPIVEGIPSVQAPEPAQPMEQQPEPAPENPRQADGPLAPPPEHDGFAPLKENAKVGTQQIMAQFPGLRFTSGYRDPKRNAAAGGVKNSKHLTGEATDFVGSEEEMQAAASWAKSQGAKVLIHDSGSGRHLHIEWA